MSKGKGHDNLAMTNQASLPGYGPPLGCGPPGSEVPPVYDPPPAYSQQQPAQQQYGLEGWRAYGYDTTNVTQPQFAPVFVPPVPPERETGPAPDTSRSLIMSVLAVVFCLPTFYIAVVAIIYNRKAHGLVNTGQYTAAKKALRTVNNLLIATVILGILSWGLTAYRIYRVVEVYNE